MEEAYAYTYYSNIFGSNGEDAEASPRYNLVDHLGNLLVDDQARYLVVRSETEVGE